MSMMEKINKLPEPVKRSFYQELNVFRIIEELRKPANLVHIRREKVVGFDGSIYTDEFPVFDSKKPIFGLAYVDYEDFMNPEKNIGEVKTKRINIDYDECLQLLLEQYEVWELVKKKMVNVCAIKRCSNVYQYNTDIHTCLGCELTEEEFDKIREALL